jgi:hypothetical protein
VIGLPPSFAGPVKVTDADALPAVAVPIVGASGTVVARTMVFEASETPPEPITFVAQTAHVYVLPSVRPVTVIGLEAPEVVPVAPPSDDTQLAVKLVIGRPPFDTGGVKLTDAVALPPVAVPIVGAPGTVAGMTAFEFAEGALVPRPLVAVTEHV